MRFTATRATLDWFLILLISIFFGWLTGRNLEDSKSSEIMTTLAIDTQGTAKVIFKLENETGAHQAAHAANNKNGNVLNQAFPKSRKIDAFSISIESDAPILISGISISRGSFLKSYTPTEIYENFEFADISSHQVNGRYLQVVPNSGAEAVKLFLKQPLELNVVSIHWKLFALGFVLAFLLISFIYQKRFAGTRGFAKVWLISFVLLFILVSVLNNLKEPLNSAEIYIKYNVNDLEPAPFLFSFSRTAQFNPTDTLSIGTMVDAETIRIKFLPGIHRHLRLDFPANDTVRIDELKFEFLFFNQTISGIQLLDFFPLVNDVEVQYQSDGSPILLTGNRDPYIQLANSQMQNLFVIGQKKKREYPFFFGAIAFFAFLVLYSVPLSMDKLLFATIFVFFLILPISLHFVKYDRLQLQFEKRIAQRKPNFDNDFEKVVDDSEAYLNDHFGGRKFLITQWNIFKIKVFNKTDETSSVLIGKDNWLFYNAEGARELFENKSLHTQGKLDTILHNVRERKAWLDLYDIDFYIIIPPLKQSIYPEYYPTRFRQREGITKREQLVKYLRDSSDVKIIDLTETIKRAKVASEHLIYYESDTHWNMLGGFYGYMEIMKQIGRDHPEIGEPFALNDFQWNSSIMHGGDLAGMISLDDYFTRTVFAPEPNIPLTSTGIASEYYPTLNATQPSVTFVNPDSTKLKLVMNRDSYANYLYPFVAEHFSRSVYLWTRYFQPVIIKSEMPDIMVTEMVERIVKDLSFENPPIMRHELDSAAAAIAASDTTLTSF